MTIYIDRRRNKAAPVTVMTPKQFHQIARALADPQRFAILERIAAERGELACKVLVQELPVSQATVSHHLRELTEAGLIECRREAQCAFLTLRSEVMQAYRMELGRRMTLGS
jgi:ArsR family transcriptional regulator, arsenate/arsenite/antimonite-responsive transcriptional repressor